MKHDITVKYKAGKSIPVADALSRVCFNVGSGVHNAGGDVQNVGGDVHNAGVDVHKEIHITTKSCPIMPEAHRGQVLKAIYTGHQRETKYLLLARESVFWPGITNNISQ